MPALADLDLPLLNLFDPEAMKDVHPWCQDQRDLGRWIIATPIGYSVIEHDAVRELLKSPNLIPIGTQFLRLMGVTEGPLFEFNERVILNLDGDEHTRIRRLVSKAFTPRAIERLRPLMGTFISDRLDELADAPTDRCEFMATIADAFPIAVICALVGAPAEDWPQFSRWAAQVFQQFSFDVAERLPVIEEAILGMDAYVEDLVARRRDEPRDDLLTELLAAEEEGERLTHRELVDLVFALIMAGTDTTRNQLGLAMLTLARHPEQWNLLGADPSLIPAAVEEALRFEPTAGAVPRITVADMTYRDVVIPAGTVLTLVSGEANRDPAAVQCPMDFDITADRGTWQSLSFGSGPHYCLGANLARAELQEALRVLTGRWVAVALDGEPEMKPMFGIFGPATLPVRFEWAAPAGG